MAMSRFRAVLAGYVGVLVYASFLFLGAWKLAYWQGLLYVGLALVGVTLTHLLARPGSELAVERASRAGEGEAWDRRILAGYFLVSIVMFVTAGLDSGRLGWSGRVPLAVTVAGAVLMVAGQALFALARRENEFFSSTARLQPGRHRVCETGPYRVVRHPGYLGMLLSLLAFPLVVQSYWAFVPAAVGALLLVERTRREDRFLLEGLAGYPAYAARTRWRLLPGAFAVLVALAAAGCQPDAAPATYAVTDSAGIEIVTSRAPAWGDSTAWTVAPEPSLRIGDASGDPAYELFAVRAVHRLPDGRIVVANGGTRQLRFYGPDGRWIRDAGGEGEGPGELRQINASLVAGDSILVYDLALDRVTVFDDRGGYARSFRLSQAPDGPAPALAGRLPDGRLILRQQVRSWMVDPEPGVQPLTVRYLLAGPDGTVRRDLGEFERMVHLVRVYEDRRVPMAVLWGRLAYFATTADGFLYGSGGRWRVLEYDTTGAVRRIVRLDRSPEPVRPGDLDAWVDSVAERSDDPATTRQWLHERYQGVELPDTKPTWVELRVGPAGDLWLRDYAQAADSPQRWTVFDSAGVWLGRLTLPDRFALHQVGRDFVLGVHRNDLDVESVALYPLDRDDS